MLVFSRGCGAQPADQRSVIAEIRPSAQRQRAGALRGAIGIQPCVQFRATLFGIGIGICRVMRVERFGRLPFERLDPRDEFFIAEIPEAVLLQKVFEFQRIIGHGPDSTRIRARCVEIVSPRRDKFAQATSNRPAIP